MKLLSLMFITVLLLASLATAPALAQDREAVVLIGHASVPPIDLATAQKLYTGRAVEVAGLAITAVNAPRGSRSRERFMAVVVAMEDDKYVAYWTVRKHIGKGTPPREIGTAAEAIAFVQANPGSVAYVLASELKQGLNVVFRP